MYRSSLWQLGQQQPLARMDCFEMECKRGGREKKRKKNKKKKEEEEEEEMHIAQPHTLLRKYTAREDLLYVYFSKVRK